MATTSRNSEPTLENPPGLETFLHALRHEGVPIGSLELERLRRLLATAPVLQDSQELGLLLGCLLVNNASQQKAFDRAFAAWQAHWPIELETTTGQQGRQPTVEVDQGQDQGGKSPDRPDRREQAAHDSDSGGVASSGHIPTEITSSESSWKLFPRLRLPRPRIGVIMLTGLVGAVLIFNGAATTLAWWTLLGGTLAIGGCLGWKFRDLLRKTQLPPPLPKSRSGPRWLIYSPTSVGGDLLPHTELREMIWSIGRYVSEDLTEQLDMNVTVARTAEAGGIFTPCYEPASYPRAVWLWVDGCTDTPLAARLAEEIEQSLMHAGLPVRRGGFAYYPQKIRWFEGGDFSPLVVEGFRQQAIVVVLTDGRGLANADQNTRTRRQLSLLLESLAGWRQLTFVDMGSGQYGMAAILAHHGISCLMPWQLTALIAGGSRPALQRRISDRFADDLPAWAGALALCPGPVALDVAQALREHLGLRLEPWQLETLLRQGRVVEGRLLLSRDLKSDWLCELNQTEWGKDGLPTEGVLLRAVDFWLAWLQKLRRKQQVRQSELFPWENTPADRELLLNESLLRL